MSKISWNVENNFFSGKGIAVKLFYPKIFPGAEKIPC
jgi:hypothetical protein